MMPPDITMDAGQRLQAISTGLTIKALVPAAMESDDPEIVEVFIPPINNSGDAYLIAKRAGTARVRYGHSQIELTPPGDWFEVTVLP
ncbi:MAG: hypothetical protein AAGB29_03050 [Planctomycetota bacterium]